MLKSCHGARSSCGDQIMENICQDRVTLSDINKVVITLLVKHHLQCHTDLPVVVTMLDKLPSFW